MKQRVVTETPPPTCAYSSQKRGWSESDQEGECVNRMVLASEHIVVSRTVSWFRLPRWTSATSPEVRELNRLVDALLSTYRDYFNDLVEREAWSESNCLGHFQEIAREVLNEDQENYNWTRIAMLLALACRMAQHCYAKGATKGFVTRFSHAVGHCIQHRIDAWVQQDDRWGSLRERGGGNELLAQQSLMRLFGVGTTIVSAIFTLMNLTQVSSAMVSFLRC